MPALGNRGVVSPKAIAKAAKEPARPIAKLPGVPPRGEAHAPMANVPAYKAPSKPSGPFSPKLQATFGGLGRQGVGAPSKLSPNQHGAETAHSPFSLHTLEDIGKAIGGAGESALHATYGRRAKTGEKASPVRPPGAAIAAPVPKSLTTAAGKDALALGELPFVGGVKFGEAGLGLAKGETKPAKELAKGIVEGVKHGAIGELVQGHPEGAAKAFQEHPVFTLTEAGGLSGIAGRSAGAALRAAGTQAEKGGVGGALARAGSTVRPPLALTDEASLAKRGTGVAQRTYSKDTIRKGLQVVADKRRESMKDAQGNVVTVKDRGRTVPVLKASPREQEKLQSQRSSFESGRTQAVEQFERDAARKQANKIEGRFPKVKPAQRLGHELSQLVASGTIRTADTFKADLQKRIATIKDALANPQHYRTAGTKANPGELRATRQNLKLLEQAAQNPTVLKNAPQIVKNGLEYGAALNRGDKRIGDLNILPAEQLQRAALSEYAFAHMNARHHEINGQPALRTAKGDLLTNEQIHAHALAAGRHPDTLAYVPHVIGAGRKSSFHAPFRATSRGGVGSQPRTGALYKRGATAIGPELVKEELTKKGVVANVAEAHDKFVHETGVRRPDGKHFNAQEGLETANRLNADGTSQWLPVRAFQANKPVEAQRALMESQSPAAMETIHQQMLNDRIVKSGDMSKTRNVVLVPKHMLDTHLRQLKPPGEAERAAQMLNAPFRMAVLPQPRWLTGNILEPYVVRLPLSGAGINLPGSAVDFRAAAKLVKPMLGSSDPKMVRTGKEIQAMQQGGLLIGRRGASVRRTYEDFPGDFGRALYGAHVVRNLPVLKQMGDLILSVPHTFFAANRYIESTAQKIAFGKTAREDLQQITGSWTKTIILGDKALEEARKGLVNTATQHRFMDEQYKLLGQYNGYNPTLRKAVQTLFPFLPWTLNSLRFVYWTLPASHTVAFTALLKASQAVQAEWEAEHKNVPPGTLSDALVRKDKGLVDIGRYTPFGATIPIAHGDVKGIPSTFAPQLSGAQKALEGQDPFGRPLQVPKTASNPKGVPSEGQKLGTALNSAAESMIPGIAMARRLQEGGGTSYANSNVFSPKSKPETSHGMSAVDRTLNPFRPTYVKPPRKGKGKKARAPKLGPSGGSAKLGPVGEGGGLGPIP